MTNMSSLLHHKKKPPTNIPVPEGFKSLMIEQILELCKAKLSFVTFIHISGRLQINLDDRETCNLCLSGTAGPSAFVSPLRIFSDGEDFVPESFIEGTDREPTVFPSEVTLKKQSKRQGSKPLHKSKKKSKKRKKKNKLVVPESLDPAEESGPVDVKLEAATNEGEVSDLSDGQEVPNVELSQDEEVQEADLDDEAEAEDFVKEESNDEHRQSPSGAEEIIPAGAETEEELRCALCEFSTRKIDSLREHIQTHNQEPTVQCSECPEAFFIAPDLDFHIRFVHERELSCSECSKLFQDVASYRSHMREQHKMKGRITTHACMACPKHFKHREDMEYHMERVHQLRCTTCGKVFRKPQSLQKHCRMVHSGSELKCDICGETASTMSALRKHISGHRTHGKGITCDLCQKSFKDKSSLYHHKKGIHGTEKRFKCDQCSAEFNFANSLKLHLLKHQGLRPHKCDSCDKSYLTASHLKNHMLAVHAETKRFVCSVCDKQFPYENSLRMHAMLHTGERPFKCATCFKGFISKQALKTHEASHIEGQHFQCDICQKAFKTEILLKAHKRRHTQDGMRYMCDVCGAHFMFKSSLLAHYPTHDDKASYGCHICGKSFKTYPSLYSHKLVHTTSAPFVCSVCNKAFKTKERLRAHEKRHLGLKPFICSQCGNSFPDKGGLAKHKRTVHANKLKFQCPVCGKGCNRTDNLRVHMKTHGDPSLLNLPLEKLIFNKESPTGDPPNRDIDLDVKYHRRVGRPRVGLDGEPSKTENAENVADGLSFILVNRKEYELPMNPPLQPLPMEQDPRPPVVMYQPQQQTQQEPITFLHPGLAPNCQPQLGPEPSLQGFMPAQAQAEAQAQADGAVALAQLSAQPMNDAMQANVLSMPNFQSFIGTPEDQAAMARGQTF